jgi:hypothetical protein
VLDHSEIVITELLYGMGKTEEVEITELMLYGYLINKFIQLFLKNIYISADKYLKRKH